MDYKTHNALQAGKTIEAAIAVLKLPVRGSYSAGEVCGILGIVDRTFWRLSAQYEVDGNGKMVRPDCLKTFLLGRSRRVAYLELVDFVRRNDEYLRNTLEEKNDAKGGNADEIAQNVGNCAGNS